jgi:hypothetical protein
MVCNSQISETNLSAIYPNFGVVAKIYFTLCFPFPKEKEASLLENLFISWDL